MNGGHRVLSSARSRASGPRSELAMPCVCMNNFFQREFRYLRRTPRAGTSAAWRFRARAGLQCASPEALDSSDFGFRLAQQGDVRSLLRNGSVTGSGGSIAQPRPLFESRERERASGRLREGGRHGSSCRAKSRQAGRTTRCRVRLTVLLRGCRKMTGCRLRPKAVTFAHGRNADVAEFERFFECPVLFRADADAIVVPNGAALNSPPLIQQLSTENFEGALREHYG